MLDELPSRLHLVAHQQGKQLVGGDGVLHFDAVHAARLGVHGGVPQLLVAHLAQSLVALDLGLGVAAHLVQQLLQLAVGVDVLLLLAPGDLVQRRLGGVDIAVLDQLGHEAVEEREQQYADVVAVHVGIGHAHDAVVAQLGGVELGPEARAEGGDHGLDLGVGQGPVDAGLFHVQYLAPQGKYGLEVPVAALLGTAAGAVALDNEDFALGRIALGAVRQLAGQRRALQGGLAAGQVAGLAGGFPGAGGGQALVQHGPRGGGVLLQVLGQLLGNHGIHQRANFAVAQLGLGLALELGLHQLDGHDGGQALAHVVAGQVGVVRLEHVGPPGVVIDDPRQGVAETRQVGTALGGVDVVGEGEHALVEAVVPLERHLDGRAVLHAGDVHRRCEQRGLVAVQVFDEGHDAALVVEFPADGGLAPVVGQHDAYAGIQEGHLAEAGLQRVEVEVAGFKDAGLRVLAGLHVRPKADGGAGAVGLAHDLQVVEDLAPLVFLLVDLAVLVDVHQQVAGQGIHHRGAHAVQAAGHLVALAAELAAGVQHRQAHLHRRAVHLGMDAHREAAAIVLHRHRAVQVQRDLDVVAVARQRFVDGVVHDLIHQVVQAPLVRGADVHARAAAHGLQPLKHLYLALVIVIVSLHILASPIAGKPAP